jgi:hypothetical protein
VWIDVPGQEERRRQTEVIGLVSQMTRSEAGRKKLDFTGSALSCDSCIYLAFESLKLAARQ